jgi:5'-methylthioadenosine phosphorylase
MTALPEAKLAREAEICYVTLAAITDYDCWHDTHETVSASLIFDNLRANRDHGAKALAALLGAIPEGRDCPCGSALKDALAPHQLRTAAPSRLRDLRPILAPYLPAEAAS